MHFHHMTYMAKPTPIYEYFSPISIPVQGHHSVIGQIIGPFPSWQKTSFFPIHPQNNQYEKNVEFKVS